MPRYFAVDTENNNEVLYIGAKDKDTGEWTECNEELLQRVRESAHERVSRRINELLSNDPTVPVVLLDEKAQTQPA